MVDRSVWLPVGTGSGHRERMRAELTVGLAVLSFMAHSFNITPGAKAFGIRVSAYFAKRSAHRTGHGLFTLWSCRQERTQNFVRLVE